MRRNFMIAHAIRRQQNDTRAPGNPRIDRLRSHAAFQFTALFAAQRMMPWQRTWNMVQ